jgi:transcriptional regulator with XRE-family HTH domain
MRTLNEGRGDMERQIIAKWLEDNERTQKWLEEKTGISQGHISEFLSGKKDIGWENIVKICEVTKTDLNALAGLKRNTSVELRVVPDGIQAPDAKPTLTGHVKIRINGYIDAEIEKPE